VIVYYIKLFNLHILVVQEPVTLCTSVVWSVCLSHYWTVWNY